MPLPTDLGLPPGVPGWLILGAPKAGTTALAGWLAAHPQVHLAPGKEVRFFNLHHERGLAWYRERLAGGEPGQTVGEATPGYLYDDAALDRIRDVVPEVRLLAVLRDPVARAWSHYWFNRATGGETRTFEQALADEAAAPPPAHPGDLVHRYALLGRYVDRVVAVTERFGREQLLVVLSHDLRHDPDRTFAAVCRHLGVADDVSPPADRDANVGATPRWPGLQPWLRTLRVDRWPHGLGRGLLRRTIRTGTPDLDPALAAELRARYAEDDRRLAEWLGRPLPWRQGI